MRWTLLLVVAGLLSPASQLAVAWDGKGKRHDKHWKNREDQREGHYRRGGYDGQCFRGEDIRVIHEYYRGRNLPPGLQKKYARTGQLPPGWQKKMQPFPTVVEHRLPPVPTGYARGYLEGYAVVYQPRSGVIIDIHAVFGR